VDTELVRPEKATILGACQVIPQEYSNITCKNIDVVLPVPGSWQEARLVDQLLAECVAENQTDRVIAYRGQQRWARTFEALRLDQDELAKSGLREQGVYLVTGGLGNVGFALARALAKNVRARLILVGRSIPPERELWADWLATHDEQDVTSAKIKMIQSLEQLGAQVMVASADVANPAQMQHVVDRAWERFGAIHGVIHAAGTVGQAMFRAVKDTGPTDAQAHFAAKVKGVQVLEDVFRGQRLDFCLLTSSLASILGGLGLAAYAAANNFMDAFAYRHNQMEPVPWVSVNWDAWQLTARQYSASGNPFGDVAITVEEGADVFRRLLSLPRGAVTKVAVSTTSLQARLDQWITREEAPKAEKSAVDTSSYSPRPTLATAYVAPRNEIEWEIAQIWQTTLGIQKVGVYDSFFELGGNSLAGVQLISNLKEKWAVQIPVVSLYEGPTVNALGKIITQLVVPDAEEQATDESNRLRGERRREKKLREKRQRKAQDTNGDVENEQ
jgi:NAD(P)-dependent dehydrogenase (short-subunit alcohol dehydrogenase family)/acyl carrier protein